MNFEFFLIGAVTMKKCSFDPQHFLVLAKRLLDFSCNDYKEACYRTIVNRCYYASMLIVREWLKSIGYTFSEDHKVHEEVEERFRFHDDIAADWLGALREFRNL